MRIRIDIPPERIADMMVGAIEGNSMTRSWCAGVYLRGAWARRQKQLEAPWYSDPKLYKGSFLLEVHEIAEETAPWKIKKHAINGARFRKGLALMATEASSHFAAMLGEADDNVTHDVFLQYVVLGKLVYG